MGRDVCGDAAWLAAGAGQGETGGPGRSPRNGAGARGGFNPPIEHAMMYQLVLQFRGGSLADYDAMIALEDRLTGDLGHSAKVDGHDCGADETNIFIFTSDPVTAF